ncbi:MAG: aminotransferase class III-fold pyridoxal phosphate-dependent enzyme, partial [Candidatus Thermoplasmatota archaeon]|nr:aminotransferase class III-fold pyridoxal phosphate-dependent enzyme [Candidatus Thermoplasmatota archaeon]
EEIIKQAFLKFHKPDVMLGEKENLRNGLIKSIENLYIKINSDKLDRDIDVKSIYKEMFQKLEIIKEENLIKNAEIQGKRLLEGLEELVEKYPTKIFNARGRGLMCAFDLPSPEKRDELKNKLFSNGMIILGCGKSTIRFRPPLNISSEEIDKALEIIDKSVKTI